MIMNLPGTRQNVPQLLVVHFRFPQLINQINTRIMLSYLIKAEDQAMAIVF
jgi:hypothetical protein